MLTKCWESVHKLLILLFPSGMIAWNKTSLPWHLIFGIQRDFLEITEDEDWRPPNKVLVRQPVWVKTLKKALGKMEESLEPSSVSQFAPPAGPEAATLTSQPAEAEAPVEERQVDTLADTATGDKWFSRCSVSFFHCRGLCSILSVRLSFCMALMVAHAQALGHKSCGFGTSRNTVAGGCMLWVGSVSSHLPFLWSQRAFAFFTVRLSMFASAAKARCKQFCYDYLRFRTASCAQVSRE